MPTTKDRVESSNCWDYVEVGDLVELTSSLGMRYLGEVDARTAEGDIIWIHDPVAGRRLFHVNDGLKLTVRQP